jgi:hypothetical protein
MKNLTLKRIRVALVAGTAAGVTMVALMSAIGLIGQQPDLAARSATIFLITSTAASAILMVFTRPPSIDARNRQDSATDLVNCPECEGALYPDWRLCPHCGTRITNVQCSNAERSASA